MTTFSIQAELDRVVPLDLEGQHAQHQPELTVAEHWDQISRNIARLGKQQLRANQSVEFLERQLEEAREATQEYRREAARAAERATEMASRILEIVDTIDDVSVLARQVGDSRWIENLDRLVEKTLRVYGRIGLTEIPAIGEQFDPDDHDALDTVAPDAGGRPYEIVEVIRRGFRWSGKVIRRAEVITTREEAV